MLRETASLARKRAVCEYDSDARNLSAAFGPHAAWLRGAEVSEDMYKRLATVGQAVTSLVLAVSVCGLAGCAQNTGSGGSDASSAEVSEQSTEAADSAEDATAEQEPLEVPDGCLDRRGNLTVLALTELPGEQLLALLAQQDYAWSERNQLWTKEDGSAAFVALDAEGKPMNEEKVAGLGAGIDEAAVSYRLVASNYATPRRAYDRLAGRMLETVDVEYMDVNVVGILHDDIARRCLVFVSTSNGVQVVNVFGEGAVEAGLFADASGLEGAKTLDGVFEKLTGRLPGEEHQ